VAALGATGLLAVGSGEPAGAGTLAACPSPITSNTTLTSDCAGPIVVGADNVRLNLAGHAVVCGVPTPLSFAIFIESRTGVSVLNGRVEPCPNRSAVGVLFGGGHRLVGLYTQAPASAAVFLNATNDNVVRRVTAVNSEVGLLLASSDNNRIVHNRFVRNDQDGLAVFGASDSNLVAGNLAFLNAVTGIRAGDLATGNRFVFNAALFNGTDLGDDHGDCSANQWESNFFWTSSPPCIG
jgi:parallel beta-helix repeat protein